MRPEIYGLPGATYQTLAGDDGGTTPIRLGLQVSPPGTPPGPTPIPIWKSSPSSKARARLDRGFLELDNNTAERSMRPIALGRKNYLFMGSDGGGKSAAIAYTLIDLSL